MYEGLPQGTVMALPFGMGVPDIDTVGSTGGFPLGLVEEKLFEFVLFSYKYTHSKTHVEQA